MKYVFYLLPSVMLIAANVLLPLTFAAYLVINAIALILVMLYMNNRLGGSLLRTVLLLNSNSKSWLLLPYELAFTSSVLIVINFCYPSADVYVNSDAHVLKLTRMGCSDESVMKPFAPHGSEDVGKTFTAVISTNMSDIKQKDVKEGFYFDLPEGEPGFSGEITYRVDDAREPLSYNLAVDSLLLQSRGYNITVHDMRDSVTAWKILIPIFLIFIFLLVFIWNGKVSPNRTSVILSSWIVYSVALVLRFFILFRLAAFPPLTRIDAATLEHLRSTSSNFLINPYYLTLHIIAILMLMTVFSKHFKASFEWFYSMFDKSLIIIWGVLFADIILLVLFGSNVLMAVAIPLLAFFAAEAIILQKTLHHPFWAHLATFTLAMLTCAVGDPGYAIGFLLFQLIFASLLITVYRHAAGPSPTRAKDTLLLLWAITLIILLFLAFFSSKIICALDTHPLHIFIGIMGLGAALTLTAWAMRWRRTCLMLFVLTPLIALTIVAGGHYGLSKKPHIKYRALVLNSSPSEIISNEEVGTSNCRKFLEASLNHWFIKEHMDMGRERIKESGIYHLREFSKVSASWDCQASDLVSSRFLIAEISILIPWLILLLLILLTGVVWLSQTTNSGKLIAIAAILSLLLDATVTLASNANMLQFVGEDFLIIGMAKVKLVLVTVLFGLPIVLYREPASLEETATKVGTPTGERKGLAVGITALQRPRTFYCFMGAFLIVMSLLNIISRFQNRHYEKAVYSVSTALSEASHDIQQINDMLSESIIRVNGQLSERQDVSSIWDQVCHHDSIMTRLDSLPMGALSRSLVHRFDSALKKCNSADNVIFLSQTDGRLQLNVNSYSFTYSLADRARWQGDIVEEFTSLADSATTSLEGVPAVWIPLGSDTYHRPIVRTVFINGRPVSVYQNDHNAWLRNITAVADYNLSGKRDVMLTLDTDLEEGLCRILRSTGVESSICVVDGSGAVRAMADYRPGCDINPNDEGAFKEVRRSAALNGSRDGETDLITNLNLVYCNPGVGSAWKPILLSEAISMFPGFSWESMQVESAGQCSSVRLITRGHKDYYQTSRFGDVQFRPNSPLESLVADEAGGEDRLISPTEYLEHSSNYFQATVASMMFHSSSKGMFRSVNPGDFPIIHIDGRCLTLANDDSRLSDESYLISGLETNFGFNRGNNMRPFLGSLSNDYVHSLFPLSHPAPPKISLDNLSRLNAADQLKAVTVSLAVSISPLNICELYGKIVSGFTDYELTLVPDRHRFTCGFRNVDGRLDDNIYAKIQQTVFPGMRACGKTGTAAYIDSTLCQNIYAKTGTLGKKGGANDRMLVVIFSRTPLERCLQGEARFITVFMRYRQSPLREVNNILRTIVASRSYANYMNRY